MHKFLCGHLFSFLLCRCVGVALLYCLVNLYYTFCETAKLFSKVVTALGRFEGSTGNVGGFQALHILILYIF